jgi:riboflavin biosynthesis pyrimidine reductase
VPTAQTIEFRQLFPESGSAGINQLVASLHLVDRAPSDRPYTIANFISTADGRAAFEGRSGRLGDEGDRGLFHGLREQVDAVIAGTNTMRIERYGRLVKDPEHRRRRAAGGLEPDPLAVLTTRSGNVATDIPLFAEPEARIVLFTPVEVDTTGCAARVSVVQLDPGEVTLTTVLRRLRRDFDVRALLCEGGPTMFGALLREGLVDELFLTLAPELTGGGGPAITMGTPLPDLQPLSLTWALERHGSLFLRYRLRGP